MPKGIKTKYSHRKKPNGDSMKNKKSGMKEVAKNATKMMHKGSDNYMSKKM